MTDESLGARLVKVVLVDDQDLIRSGLRRILRRRDGFEVVAECADGDQLPEVMAGLEAAGAGMDGVAGDGGGAGRADVVVMDLRMRRVDGIEATRRLRSSPDAPPVLVLTTFDDDELLSGALRAGAAGFVLKDSPAEDLIRAVRSVAQGQAWLDPGVTARVLSTYRTVAPHSPSPGGEELTLREREVLGAVGRGRNNREIAEELGISELTVKSHVSRIFTKLDLRDRPAAVVYAFDQGIVAPQ